MNEETKKHEELMQEILRLDLMIFRKYCEFCGDSEGEYEDKKNPRYEFGTGLAAKRSGSDIVFASR